MIKLNTILYSAFVFASLLLFLNPAKAQWQQTNGPLEAQINCMIKHDTVVLCGTLQGMYYSSDSGNSWFEYQLFQNKNIQAIYSKGDTIILLHATVCLLM